MHERALVSRAAGELATLVGETPVGHVTLAVNPETDWAVVEQAWHSITTGTAIESAGLARVIKPHDLCCLSCGAEYRGGKLSVCPSCGGNGLVVEGADEVALDSWLAEGPA